VKALFALRTLPSRFTGTVEKVERRLDAIASITELPEWEVKTGDGLELHPDMPPLRAIEVEGGRHGHTYGVAIEPIGFAMDRRMLLGVKERVERRG
jgi:hypothetical protein